MTTSNSRSAGGELTLEARGLVEAVAREAVLLAIVRSELEWDEATEQTEESIAQDAADALFGDGTCAEEPTHSAKQLIAILESALVPAQPARGSEKLRELVAKWREAITKLWDGVKDSPSHDLKRMIKERIEAVAVCANELEALLTAPPAPALVEGCAEHKIPLVDGRCDKCRDSAGNTFVLDMQSKVLLPSAPAGEAPQAESEVERAKREMRERLVTCDEVQTPHSYAICSCTAGHRNPVRVAPGEAKGASE